MWYAIKPVVEVVTMYSHKHRAWLVVVLQKHCTAFPLSVIKHVDVLGLGF